MFRRAAAFVLFITALIAVASPRVAHASVPYIHGEAGGVTGPKDLYLTTTLYQGDGLGGWQSVDAERSWWGGQNWGAGFYFEDLAPGTYRLCTTAESDRFQPTWYGGTGTTQTAQDIEVYDWSRIEGLLIRMRLAHPGIIRGRVTSAYGGQPLANVVVYLNQPSANGMSFKGAETKTAADGTYSFDNLGPGTWCVAFADPSGVYRGEFYPHSGLPPMSAPSITTIEGVAREGIDASLVRMADQTSGKRTPRVYGADRYQTAIAVSKRNFAAAEDVVLVSGRGFADAVAASPLAGAFDAPILLTDPAALPSGLLAELTRLKTKRVFIVGGETVVYPAVAEALVKAGIAVERISGPTRYHTAAEVTRYLVDQDVRLAPEPFVVRGDMFPDALSVSPYAWWEIRPVVLVLPSYAPTASVAALESLGATSAIVIGSDQAVGLPALRDLAGGTPGGTLSYGRIYGDDRYETSARIADLWGPVDYLGVATGANYPDALAGGVGIGSRCGALLLSWKTGLPHGPAEVMRNTGRYLWEAQVYGSSNAIDTWGLKSVQYFVGNVPYSVSASNPSAESLTALSSSAASIAPEPRGARFDLSAMRTAEVSAP